MMNKSELIDQLSIKNQITKAQAGRFLDSVTEIIRDHLSSGVKISGFGTFQTSVRKARVARNPQTGAEIRVPEKNVPVFKAAAVLKQAALDA